MNITPEVIAALATLRRAPYTGSQIADALNTLDNAGIFAAVDEATGYDMDPEPERVSKCTCPRSRVSFPGGLGNDIHTAGCPGDPAEYGDMAFTTAPVKAVCDNDCETKGWMPGHAPECSLGGTAERAGTVGRSLRTVARLTPQFGAYLGARAKQ